MFRLTNVIPQRIIFVSRGITVVTHTILSFIDFFTDAFSALTARHRHAFYTFSYRRALLYIYEIFLV